ncbi:hypothetical protein V6N12_058292 [Hibiscus sabdariffa]|uniref:Reverse transcriptase/retrotransposon-derived protein RNase H-like domain-containing protein n=1 Tax=Hibiscus sabdariffa TaxID=183260 RepID=A0ABR2ETN6_9ROSI
MFAKFRASFEEMHQDKPSIELGKLLLHGEGRHGPRTQVVAPDWSKPFELMCNANDIALGAVLGQRHGKVFQTVYYAKFDLQIRDKKGSDNLIDDHLSCLEHYDKNGKNVCIRDEFPDEYLLADESILFKQCVDQVIRRCVPEDEQFAILQSCHAAPYGGHFVGMKTAAKETCRELISFGRNQKQQDLEEGSCTEATPIEKT